MTALPRAAPECLRRTVFVRGLTILARIGVYAHEALAAQPLLLDVELALDPAHGPARDDMSDALDYDWIASEARRLGSAAHLKLVETFAEQLAEAMLADSRVVEVRIRLEKPHAIPDAAAAGIEVRFRRGS